MMNHFQIPKMMLQTLSLFLPKRFLQLLFTQIFPRRPSHLLILLPLLLLFILSFPLTKISSPPHRPIEAPNLSDCKPIFIPSASSPHLNCCPPILSPHDHKLILQFKFPLPSSPLRTRPAAHLLDPNYISQYSKAVQLMKDLPISDPRSFHQQANVHCAYCNGAYDQPGFANLQLLIHGSWLFFPWHRLYLYFHERILAKLIGNDSFAIPFWNWDSPASMQIPFVFSNTSSSLYHPNRDPAHQPPVLLDLNFLQFWLRNESDLNAYSVDDNLWIMYRQIIENGATTELFMGSPFRAGDEPEPGGGSVEFVPHDTVHTWTGDPRKNNNEDMGAFYAAARDPIFYPHHANIDRLWSVWKTLAPNHNDFDDSDWLDSSFHFYDEEARLVRVKIRDCLDMERLRYRYQEVDNEWINIRKSKKKSNIGLIMNIREKKNIVKFPVRVENENVVFSVKRRRRSGKKEQVEVLVIEGIEIINEGRDYSVRFDVYVNASPEDLKRPNARKCAGSFVSLARLGRVVNGRKTNLKLGISELIEEEEDEAVTVALVPRNGKATVSRVYITWMS